MILLRSVTVKDDNIVFCIVLNVTDRLIIVKIAGNLIITL